VRGPATTFIGLVLRLRLVPRVVLVATACASPDDAGYSAVRDSAGITIVESAAPAWTQDGGWRIVEPPELSIGVVDGPPEQQLYRVSGVLRLHDGRILIANAGSFQLRYYDAGGNHLRSVGAEGDGPGEFRGSIRLYRYGADSLVTYDTRLRRFSVFSIDGEFARSVPMPEAGSAGSPLPFGMFADGSVFLRTSRTYTTGALTEGRHIETSTLLRLPLDGSPAVPIGEFPAREMFFTVLPGGLATMTAVPFERRLATAVHENRLFVGVGERFEIDVRGADGGLERVIRIDRANPPLPRSLLDTTIAQRVAGLPNDARQNLAAQLAAVAPPTIPPYLDFWADRAGNLWVTPYLSLYGTDRLLWTVIDPQGRWLGDVLWIERFIPYEIGDDWILGRRLDSLDIERIELYRILK
jgi:hypothetical protein